MPHTEYAEDLALRLAIEDTEREIFDEAVGNVRTFDDDTMDRLSAQEGWDGNPVDDGELLREATGEIGVGTAGLVPTAEAEELAAENAALREQLAALQPAPEPADIFSDPDGWQEQLLRKAGGDLPIDFGAPTPNKPDPFADPAGYERWMVAEIGRRSEITQHHAQRFESSMQNAHRIHGEDFERAYNDFTSMDPRDPQARRAVQQIFAAADPGSALLQLHGALRGATEAAEKYGGPLFAPRSMMGSRGGGRSGGRSPSRGLRSDDTELGGFGSAADETEIWDSLWR
jgi:hypothetical protein